LGSVLLSAQFFDFLRTINVDIAFCRLTNPRQGRGEVGGVVLAFLSPTLFSNSLCGSFMKLPRQRVGVQTIVSEFTPRPLPSSCRRCTNPPPPPLRGLDVDYIAPFEGGSRRHSRCIQTLLTPPLAPPNFLLQSMLFQLKLSCVASFTPFSTYLSLRLLHAILSSLSLFFFASGGICY